MPVKPGSEHANDSYLPTSVSSVRLKHEGPHHMYMYVIRASPLDLLLLGKVNR